MLDLSCWGQERHFTSQRVGPLGCSHHPQQQQDLIMSLFVLLLFTLNMGFGGMEVQLVLCLF